MSDVASLDNCRELFELSRGKLLSEWGSTYFYYTPDKNVASGWTINPGGGTGSKDDIPAYDLHFLFNILPYRIDNAGMLRVTKGSMSYVAYYPGGILKRAPTAPDSLCKLAIELFKQGILKRKG